MGLAISVGSLAFSLEHDPEAAGWLREEFVAVNRLLAANGFPPHTEPESLAELKDRSPVSSVPYGWIQYLRRAVSFALQAPDQFYPTPPGVDPAKDDRYDRELSLFFRSHVCCHSDCEGYYVPVDFPSPLYFEHDVLGGILGSSRRALNELVKTAPLLGIRLHAGRLSDQEAERIAHRADDEDPLRIELMTWLYFFERLRTSVEHGAAIRFE